MKRAMLLGLILVAFAYAQACTAAEQFEVRDGTVVARDGSRVLWENRHDRAKNFRAPDRPGHLVGPVLAGGSLYYAIGVTLFEVHPASGAVKRRLLLPAPCTKLVPEGDAVLLDLASSDPQRKWSRRYRVSAGVSDVPFFLPGLVQGARMARTDAEGVLSGLLEADPKAPKLDPRDAWRTKPEFHPYLKAAAQELERLARWDTTNPWYRYLRGAYLHVLGREAGARAAFRSVLALEPAYDFELVGLALPLDEVAPELVSEAFRRGMHFLLAHGYEPEMSPTVLAVALYLGRSAPIDPKQQLDRLNRIGERVWDFAPYAEFATWMYQGLASANRDAGLADAAAVWEARAAATAPAGLVYAGPSARWAGIGLNAFAASLIAVALTLVLKGLRCAPDPRRARGFARWNAFAGWTRSEIVGFLLVHILLLMAVIAMDRGITAISRSAAIPLSAISGNFGHPDGVEYFATLQGTPEGDFVYGLALQKAGGLHEAARIYQDLPFAQAHNNLGVILRAQGNEAEARKQFEQARAADPTLGEAAYNLREQASSARVERARKFRLAGPLVAMPTLQMWSQALAGPLELWNLPARALSLYAAPSEESSTGARVFSLAVAALITLLYVGVGVLAVVGLIAPQPAGARSRRTLVGWGLGFVVPGTARQLGLLGPPLLALCAFSYFVHYALQLSDGLATDIFSALAIPNVTRYYPIAEVTYTPLELAVRNTRNLFWILWIGNLIAVVILERLFPDPAGPRAK